MDGPRWTSTDSGSVNVDENIYAALKFLKNEVLELYLPMRVPEIKEIPEPLEFYRDFVTPNIPVIIKGAIKSWPAVKKWTQDYLSEKLRDKLISVAVTPDGHADSINETEIGGKKKEIFVLPEERLMTISDFYKCLESTDPINESSGVYYIQKQNSNLVEEFPELLPDIDAELLWATKTFKQRPSAINLWIGDERAVTSLHKDPFENIYCVVSGYKEFILIPPTDRPWLPYKVLPVGQYKEKTPGRFEIIPVESDKWKFKDTTTSSMSVGNQEAPNNVPWVALDPFCPNYEKFPLYALASPLKVKVEQGDALYLPSLWYHSVRQSDKCIAVNFWYDMCFDIKYAYFQLLDQLSTYMIKSK